MNNIEFWGNYKGYQVFKYYGKDIKSASMQEPEKIFAVDGKLWREGCVIGEVTKTGEVKNFDPDKPKREKVKNGRCSGPTVVNFDSVSIPNEFNTDDLLEKAMRRSIDDLVGKKLSE